MNRRFALFPLCALILAAGCGAFSEAMSAHNDVAARAGSQELSVDRLASLLAHAKAPLQKELAHQLTDLWVDYQLLGEAAARGDSLNAQKDQDEALWAVIGSARARKWLELVAKNAGGDDTAAMKAKYNAGDVLSARHILIMAPRGDTSKTATDSVRKKAEAIRAKVTKSNFAQMATENSQDPGSAKNGGDLKVFQKGQMVPEFEKAILSTTPGSVTPGLVKTQFGYHIIYRPTFDEVKGEVAQAAGGRQRQVADSTYLAKLDSNGKINILPNALATVKAVASDIDAHKNDKTVIATSVNGNFTSADLSHWLSLFPAAQRTRLTTDVPDSAIPQIVRGFIKNELVMRAADSAKVTLDSSQQAEIHKGYEGLITNSWLALNVDPKQLADSAKAVPTRERIAAAHIDSYLDKLLAQAPGVRFVDIPSPLEDVLRTHYQFKLNEAGIDLALAHATAQRHSSDSAKSASEPPSAVPLPGLTPATPQQGTPPQGTPPKH
ncbi:MAG TPA: peptidylprolyl isomerase [Gemmatimonadaceae bacterium]|nr:peptidylprolyl isomerase [Gemmatimonadaceae bacterium]